MAEVPEVPASSFVAYLRLLGGKDVELELTNGQRVEGSITGVGPEDWIMVRQGDAQTWTIVITHIVRVRQIINVPDAPRAVAR